MSNRLRRLVVAGRLVVSVLVVIGVLVHTRVAKQKEIRLGWIGPLTGDAAPYGIAVQRGTKLAVKEINARGEPGVPLKVIYEDDQAKPNLGLTAFQKLAEVDREPIVIQAAASSVMLAVMPRAEEAKVVYISPTCSSDKIRAGKVSRGYKYIFRTWPSDAYQAQVLAEFAFLNLSARKAAIVYINTDYGADFRDVFTKRFEELGGTIVLSEGFGEGTTDFRSLLTKTKDAAPDVVFMPSHYKEAAQLLRQAKELAVTLRFLSDAALYSPELLKVAGNAAEGLMLTAPSWSAESQEPRIKAFVDSFRAEYEADPDVYAAAGYDCVHVLAAAIGSGWAGDTTVLKQRLLNMKPYEGVTGSLEFDAIGEVRWGFVVLQVMEGQFCKYGMHFQTGGANVQAAKTNGRLHD